MCITSKKIRTIAEKTKTPRLQGSVSVATAMEVMDIYEVDVIAVECEDDFAGVFGRSDFNCCVIRHHLNPKDTTLYEVMKLNAPTVEAEQSIKETYEAMVAYQSEYMPVLEGRKLCGIVFMRDLGKDVIQSFEEARTENEMIKVYIQSGESYAIAKYNH